MKTEVILDKLESIAKDVMEIKAEINAEKASEKFKDGDFVAKKNQYGLIICIYKATEKRGEIITYAGYSEYYITTTTGKGWGYTEEFKGADNLQRDLLIEALKNEGKKWNAEAKRIEDLEYVPKDGDVVTNEYGSVFIFKKYNMVGNCGFYAGIYNGCFHAQSEDTFENRDLRPATHDERCKFFERLVKEGYKWDSKKLKLTNKNEKWRAKIDDCYSFISDRCGEFVIIGTVEAGHYIDNSRFKSGNYFNPATGDAAVALKKIKDIFNG